MLQHFREGILHFEISPEDIVGETAAAVVVAAVLVAACYCCKTLTAVAGDDGRTVVEVVAAADEAGGSELENAVRCSASLVAYCQVVRPIPSLEMVTAAPNELERSFFTFPLLFSAK